MMSLQFARSEHDSCVYVKEVNPGEFVYLLLYVDDMLLATKSKSEISKLKEALSLNFEMKDMGAASKILVIDIIRNMKEGTLRLSQTRYVDKVIQRFRMADAKVVSTPMGAHFKLISIIDEIGSLDPEVFPYSSAVCSVMMGEMHWEAVKWILRYLKGLRDLNLVFTKGANLEVQGYCDSNHAADLDRRRSISGYVFTVGG
ncbi:putative RNA-directed DNA polymerase [Arabidopsis thaliana]